VRLAAGELDHEWRQGSSAERAAHHVRPGIDKLFAGNHFADNQASAVLMGKCAEGLIRHTRHGGQENPVAGFDVTDPYAH
jgi:hypothetical protein